MNRVTGEILLRDDLMVAYMTVFSVWPFKLAVIAFTAWWLLHIGWRATGIAVITLFVLVSIAVWQFEYGM